MSSSVWHLLCEVQWLLLSGCGSEHVVVCGQAAVGLLGRLSCRQGTLQVPKARVTKRHPQGLWPAHTLSSTTTTEGLFGPGRGVSAVVLGEGRPCPALRVLLGWAVFMSPRL